MVTCAESMGDTAPMDCTASMLRMLRLSKWHADTWHLIQKGDSYARHVNESWLGLEVLLPLQDLQHALLMVTDV